MRHTILVTVLAILVPGAVEAQSLFSAAGLGIPVESLDGRSRALGSVGVGLMGPEVSQTDPAALGLLTAPTAIITSQPSWVDFERSGGGESGSFQSTRFPLVGVAYHAWKAGMMSLSFGGFLDQRYAAERETTVDLSTGPADVTDSFVSDGGVSQVNLGWGRRLGSRFGVGLSVGRYSGRVVRRFTRQFGVDDALIEAQQVNPNEAYQAGGRWGYSGTTFTGGASARFGQFARVAGSVTWAGTLNAEASEDTQGADASYDLPMQMRLGGSALLAPGLMLAASISRADWTDTGASMTTGAAGGSATSYGFGLELSRASLLGRRAPLRFGYRSSDLPFEFDGGSVSESVLTGGLGLILNEQAGLILASVDLGFERGERKDLTLVEKFWRGTLTLRVAGF
jgi:hypothetical protein